MSATVKKFRHYFVEARFAALSGILIMLAMRTGLFLMHGIPAREMPDTSFIWRYLAPLFANPLVSFASSTVAILIIALLLSHLNNRFSLLHNRSNLVFIAPLFIFSLHPMFLEMKPDLVSIIVILCAFYPLLNSYQQYDTPIYSFKSAVLIAIAGVFQVFALLLIPYWLKGEYSMRRVNFKSVLGTLFGLALVFWILFSLFYLTDNLGQFLGPFGYFAHIVIPNMPLAEAMEWIQFSLVLIMFLIFRYFLSRSYSRAKVLTQITLRFMILLAVSFIILETVYWKTSAFPFLLSITLISYLVAYFYSSVISRWAVYGFYAILVCLSIFYLINLSYP